MKANIMRVAKTISLSTSSRKRLRYSKHLFSRSGGNENAKSRAVMIFVFVIPFKNDTNINGIKNIKGLNNMRVKCDNIQEKHSVISVNNSGTDSVITITNRRVLHAPRRLWQNTVQWSIRKLWNRDVLTTPGNKDQTVPNVQRTYPFILTRKEK